MEKQKTLGVTEARFGLTLLICGLVAIGYIVLLRTGITNDAAVEQRHDIELAPRIALKTTPDEEPPTVLPLKPEASFPPRPERSLLPKHGEDKNSTDLQRR
jgi:hypothetical protein